MLFFLWITFFVFLFISLQRMNFCLKYNKRLLYFCRNIKVNEFSKKKQKKNTILYV